MSNGVYQRYALDPTGLNPDNFVADEPHQLSDKDFRFVVPKHGPFYVESLRVFDGMTLVPLVKMNQFIIPVISQEATLRFGKEIADAILITDKNVAATVYINYQSLGGLFQNNIDNIVNMYESFVNDQRAVDWMTGVFGKPYQYPAGPHAHVFSDLFGYEVLTFGLEQIRQAILLGNSPAYDQIFTAINERIATKADIQNGVTSDKFITLEVLQHSAKYYNFNTIKLSAADTSIRNGKSTWITVEESNAVTSDKLFWKIKHITSTDGDFVLTSGIVTLSRGVGKFLLQTTLEEHPELEKSFEIQLFRGGLDMYEVYRSPVLKLMKHASFYQDRILEALRVVCVNSPRIRRTAKTYGANRSLWNAKQS